MGEMYFMAKKGIAMVFCVMAIYFLASCAAVPDSAERDGIKAAAGENLNGGTGQTSGNGKGSDTASGKNTEESQENVGDVKTEEPSGEEKSPEEQNAEILAAAAGTKIEKTMKRADGKELLIDAGVDVEGVGRISLYRYVLESVTEGIRQKLFESVFPTRASEMKHDERNNVWELRNSSQGGDYWLYLISFSNGGTTIPGEEIIVLEYRYYDLYPFEDNRLKAVSDSRAAVSAEEAAEACGEIAEAVAAGDDLAVDYIHAYGTGGRRPYYKIVFKRMLDGMPVTTYNNLSFLYDNEGLEKVWGSLFSVEETGLEAPILTAEEAVDSLERQAVYLNFEERTRLFVSEIAPEYVTLMTSTGDILITPVWRFRLGEDADERNYLREKILAINAVTGDLIWEERGNTF